MISPIDRLQPLAALTEAPKTVETVQTAEQVPFGAVFRSAVDNVRQTDAEKVQTDYLLATGQLDNPAQSTIAGTKYQMAVELLVQLRNRALDAYSELTRINM